MGKLRLVINVIGICAALYLTIIGVAGALPSWIGGIAFLLVAIYGAVVMWTIKALARKSAQIKDKDATIMTILEDIKTGDINKYQRN